MIRTRATQRMHWSPQPPPQLARLVARLPLHAIPAGLLLWLAWLLANTVSWPLGFLAAGYARATLADPLADAITGIVIGVSQWLVLRKHLRGAYGWLPVTTAAYAIGLIIDRTLGTGTSPFLTITCVSVGFLQWCILSSRVLRSHAWIVANTVGWVAGFAAVRFIPGVTELARNALAGLVAGVITGGTLLLLLRHTILPVTNRLRLTNWRVTAVLVGLSMLGITAVSIVIQK